MSLQPLHSISHPWNPIWPQDRIDLSSRKLVITIGKHLGGIVRFHPSLSYHNSTITSSIDLILDATSTAPYPASERNNIHLQPQARLLAVWSSSLKSPIPNIDPYTLWPLNTNLIASRPLLAPTISHGARKWRLCCTPRASGDWWMARRSVQELLELSRMPGMSSRTGLLVKSCSTLCQSSEYTSGSTRMTPAPLGLPCRPSVFSRSLQLVLWPIMSSSASGSPLRSPSLSWLPESSKPCPGSKNLVPPSSLWPIWMMNCSVWRWFVPLGRITTTSHPLLPCSLIWTRIRSRQRSRPRKSIIALILMGPALFPLTLSCLPVLAHAPVTSMCPALFVRRLNTVSASALLCSAPGRITSPRSARGRRPTKSTMLALSPLLDFPHHLPLLPLLLHLLSPLPLRMLRTLSNVQEMQVFIPVIHVIPSLPFSSMLMLIGMQTQVPLLIWRLIATGCANIPLIACQSSWRITRWFILLVLVFSV